MVGRTNPFSVWWQSLSVTLSSCKKYEIPNSRMSMVLCFLHQAFSWDLKGSKENYINTKAETFWQILRQISEGIFDERSWLFWSDLFFESGTKKPACWLPELYIYSSFCNQPTPFLSKLVCTPKFPILQDSGFCNTSKQTAKLPWSTKPLIKHF